MGWISNSSNVFSFLSVSLSIQVAALNVSMKSILSYIIVLSSLIGLMDATQCYFCKDSYGDRCSNKKFDEKKAEIVTCPASCINEWTEKSYGITSSSRGCEQLTPPLADGEHGEGIGGYCKADYCAKVDHLGVKVCKYCCQTDLCNDSTAIAAKIPLFLPTTYMALVFSVYRFVTGLLL